MEPEAPQGCVTARTCAVDGCELPVRASTAKSAYHRCEEHNREYQRDWYRRDRGVVGKRKYRMAWPFHELFFAIALTAAYQNGYRHGTADRTIALLEQHREAREEAERSKARQATSVYDRLQRERLGLD